MTTNLHQRIDGHSAFVDADRRESARETLTYVPNYFGLAWLEGSYGNPIQHLWQRQDAQAATELLILGNALQRLSQVDAGWVSRRVKAAKGRQHQSRIGDIFELVGLAALCHGDQRVVPAREGQPGFDGTVILPNGFKVFVSMKNHDASTHETLFIKRASSLTISFTASLNSSYRNGISLAAFANTYPDERGWSDLARLISKLFRDAQPFASPDFQRIGIWAARFQPLPKGESAIAAEPKSYSVTLFAPFHKNEQINLISKLADGAANFEKHTAQYSGPYTSRCLFIRLSETANVELCTTWCNDYFRENPVSHIDYVIFYQPTVVSQEAVERTSISHYFGLISHAGSNAFTGKDRSQGIMRFEVPVGLILEKPSKVVIQGTANVVGDNYMFQRGDVYLTSTTSKEGTVGSMKILAPGILQHSVFSLPSIGQLGTISGNFAKTDRLFLFS